MNKLFALVTIIIALMSALLLAAKAQGLHPDFKAFACMIPFMYLLAWGRYTLIRK
jgi:hypothetical protein